MTDVTHAQRGRQDRSPSGTQDRGTGDSGASVQLRGKSLAEQQAALAPGNVQMHGDGGGGGDVHSVAAAGVSGGGGALPHLGAIQQSFGRHDVSQVQAHVGGGAADAAGAIGAEAYTTGSHVAFASQPDLHLAAHEAAHVVQQSHGVQLKGGVGTPGDSYERHADEVADAVVAGKSAEGILDRHAGGGGGESGGVQSKAVQMDHVCEVPVPMDPSTADSVTGDDLTRILGVASTMKQQFDDMHDAMLEGVRSFERWVSISHAPPSVARSVGEFVRDELIKWALGELGTAGKLMELAWQTANQVETATNALTEWREEVAIATFVQNLIDQLNNNKQTASDYWNGEQATGTQALFAASCEYEATLQGPTTETRSLRTQYVDYLVQSAQAFNLDNIASTAYEQQLYGQWINENTPGGRNGTGKLNLTYRVWEGEHGRAPELREATLDTPGDTGIIERMRTLNAGATTVADYPIQKWITVEEWESPMLSPDRKKAGVTSGYDENTRPNATGTWGHVHESRIGRDFLGGTVRNLAVAWSDISAG